MFFEIPTSVTWEDLDVTWQIYRIWKYIRFPFFIPIHTSVPPATLSTKMEISGGDLYLEHAVRASLVDYLDKPVIITLRDGRHLIGELM